jgi:hypothetical protein
MQPLPAPPLRADVVCSDGQTYHVTGRAAAMVLWLCQKAAQIEAAGKGEVVLSFAGEQITPRLLEVFEGLTTRANRRA